MTNTIRAAVVRKFGAPMTIENIELAEPKMGEVQVRMKACAICHSDIVYAQGGWGGELPMVLGHEAAGIVEAVGPGVTRAKIGDHVAVTLIRSCGGCHYCSAGDGFLCEEVFPLDQQSPLSSAGQELTHGLRTGAFAEAVVVDQSQIVAVPNDVPMEVVSLMSCGVITGVGAVTNTAKMPAGSHAVVIGCGGVGLNAVQGAALSGARSLIAIDLSDDKLEAAAGFGATHGFNPMSGDVVAQVMAATGGKGADYVFVTVGAKQAIEGAQSYIKKSGTIVVVGMPENGVMTAFDPSTLAAWDQKIIGSKMGSSGVTRDIPWLVDLYQSGKLRLDEMVTGRYKLDQINDAIASTKRGDALRNVIVFD